MVQNSGPIFRDHTVGSTVGRATSQVGRDDPRGKDGFFALDWFRALRVGELTISMS